MSDPPPVVPGPASGPVRLSAASPDWVGTVARERERLAEALGTALLCVHHIGSTAIPGIRAKPIVDLLPVVAGLPQLDAGRRRLEAIGYHWWGEYGIAGRRYCTLQDSVSGQRAVNAHFFAENDREIERHVAFRDYVSAHADVARDYEAVKLRAAALHPDDVNEYNAAKSGWIRAIEPVALAYYRARR